MIFVLPILVLLVAITRPRGQAPSPAKKRQRKAEAAAPKVLYATDVFTRRTHEFSGPGAYAECRNMMNRVTFVLPPGQRKPSDAWPGHFGIFSTDIKEKQRLFECAGCGAEVWTHLCREVSHQENMERLNEAKRRALELGFDDIPVQRLACTICYEAPAALGQPTPADDAGELANEHTGALNQPEPADDTDEPTEDPAAHATLQQEHAALQQEHDALQQEHAALLQSTLPIDRAPPEPDTGSPLATSMIMTSDLQLEFSDLQLGFSDQQLENLDLDDLLDMNWP